MVDDNLEPYLLEINHAPSFSIDTPLDLQVKHDLIYDTFKLLNMSVERKCEYKVEQLRSTQQRIFTGKKAKLTPEERKTVMLELDKKRHEYEMSNLGSYELIYSEQDKKLQKRFAKYMKDADFVSEQFTTGNKYKKKMEELAEASKKNKNAPKFRTMLT